MDGYYARKRKGGPSYNPRHSRPRLAARAWSRLIAPSAGYQRTGGYFGRFNRGGAYSRLRRSPFVNRRDVEKKFHDVTSGSTLAATWTASTSQNLVAQGVTEVQRVGRKMVIKDIHCQGQFSLAAQNDVAAPSSGAKVRAMLIWDKQANGANATTADVLEDNTDINTFHNLANKGRFVTLYSFVDTLQLTAGSGTGVTGDFSGEIKSFSYHKKVNIPIEYDSTTGAITEIKSNNLFWLFGTTQTASLTNVGIKTRLRFTDM